MKAPVRFSATTRPGILSNVGWVQICFVRLMLVFAVLLLPATALADDLKLHVIDVGQGDGMLVQCPDGSIAAVIDSADPREGDGGLGAWKSYVQNVLPIGTTIPVVISSHPHADHIGGISWVLENYPVHLVVDNGRQYKSRTYERYVALRGQLLARQYDKAVPWASEVKVCDSAVTLTYWVPPGFTNATCKRDANECSVFVRIDYGTTSMLLTGDAHHEAEHALLGDQDLRHRLDVDVLKVGHHGSYTSSSTEFLNAVTPTCAVISSGDRDESNTNRRRQSSNGRWRGYGHPRLMTIQKLNSVLGAAGRGWSNLQAWAWNGAMERWQAERLREGLLITANVGTIVVGTDGSTVKCGSSFRGSGQ